MNQEIETEAEREILVSLCWMCLQYMTVKDSDPEYMDTLAMSAGERAIELLSRYGLVKSEVNHRFGTWTEKGKELMGW